MTDGERLLQTKAVIEMISSFFKSVDKAGGNPFNFNLETMTVVELVAVLATNDIRFIYKNKDKLI